MEHRFLQAMAAANRDLGCKGIGTLRERSLHLALKYYFAPDAATHEQAVGGFVADAITEDGVIEVQTRNFSRLKEKLNAFLAVCPVTVVHPIANPKWVIWVDENGEVQSRRKSPKKETIYHCIRELYSLRDLIGHPRLRFAICEMEIEVYRCLNGYGKQKKHRGEHIDRVPVALRNIRYLDTPADYLSLLPEQLPNAFIATELSEIGGMDTSQARMLLNLLERLDLVEKVGKRGRAVEWALRPMARDIMGR